MSNGFRCNLLLKMLEQVRSAWTFAGHYGTCGAPINTAHVLAAASFCPGLLIVVVVVVTCSCTELAAARALNALQPLPLHEQNVQSLPGHAHGTKYTTIEG